MPRPPPPAAAFTTTGYPHPAAAARAVAASHTASSVPAGHGTPTCRTAARAAILSPISRITFDGGPTKVTPTDSHACAKSASSDRNPYPGCTAVAPVAASA